MKFSQLIEDALKGRAFDNALDVQIGGSSPLENRMDLLKRLVTGKRIIHVGFVDHYPLIARKIELGQWLHGELVEAADRCIGVDLNEEGVTYVSEELGFNDVVCMDLQRDEIPASLLGERWDFIVLADVIEHISDPVDFLSAIREKFHALCKRVIVTTPNAFRLNNFYHSLAGRELINSDHRYWFTPYTLAKISMEAGFSVASFNLCQSEIIPERKALKRFILKRFILKRFNLLRDTVIMELAFDDG